MQEPARVQHRRGLRGSDLCPVAFTPCAHSALGPPAAPLVMVLLAW